METKEKPSKSVTSAAAAAASTNLENILQELNVLSECMNQLACMHHCKFPSSPFPVVPAGTHYVSRMAPATLFANMQNV